MFALQALERAGLDAVYFMPERRPRQKTQVEHYGHRVAMVRRALQPHPRLDVLETDDISFTVTRTFRRLQQQFADDQLVFLMGSDVATHLHSWPGVERVLIDAELAIGLRAGGSLDDLRRSLAALPISHSRVHILESFAPHVSSTEVRLALNERRHTHGILPSVARYSDRNWLYVSLA
jgi:nicotinate (nicotinamide) nucleotide adenylyltransferase